MAALARGRELAMPLAPPSLHHPLAFARLPALTARLHAPPLVMVGRVILPPLPVEVPVQPAQRLRVEGDLGAVLLEERETTARAEGPRSSPTIPVAQLVLRQLPRHPLAHQLDVETAPLSQLAAHQPHWS